MAHYTISELSREFGVTPRAIRFYEDQRLLAPARIGAGGRQRRYSQRDRTRLKLTLRGKRLGLSLAEIRDLVDMYESPSDTAAQLDRFLAMLVRNRQKFERQLHDLRETLDEIAEHERRVRTMLAELDGQTPPPAHGPAGRDSRAHDYSAHD